MTPERIRAMLDAAWTGVVLGALAVVFRHEIRSVLTAARRDMDARTAELRTESHRREFLSYLRAQGIEPSAEEIERA